MKTTASDVLIDAIHDWGVDVVFGLPGDGINGIMEALRKRADKIRARKDGLLLFHPREIAARPHPRVSDHFIDRLVDENIQDALINVISMKMTKGTFLSSYPSSSTFRQGQANNRPAVLNAS